MALCILLEELVAMNADAYTCIYEQADRRRVNRRHHYRHAS
jgi:hypothetical protein